MGAPGLRIVTLNAASYFEDGWPERRHEVLAWLDRLDPDVVCLQETWEDDATPNSGTALAADAPAGRWHAVSGGRPLPPGVGAGPSVRFGSTVLSRWPIETSAVVPLVVDDRPDPPHPGWAMRMTLLHARTAGIDVFSAHLAPPPRQAHLRMRQVRQIDLEICRRADPTAALPPVLCGDFNAEPDADEIRYLCGLTTVDGQATYYQEAWRAAGRTDPGWTWDGRRNPAAASMSLQPARIDFVFVGDPFRRPDGAGLVEAAGLAFDEPLTGVLASDHFGVVVDVRWPQRPAA
ncbi:MAG TPA: endonuclease/exonuclease/phosphatase family protein [Acidimicrobiales bacterium]|nr:endonuclease/exonuclease/phosphatase family protein [Acidimicrobiales bacterium]